MGRGEELDMLLNGDLEILKTVDKVVLYSNGEHPIAILFDYFYEERWHLMFIEYQTDVDKLHGMFLEASTPIKERTITGKTIIMVSGHSIVLDPNK